MIQSLEPSDSDFHRALACPFNLEISTTISDGSYREFMLIGPFLHNNRSDHNNVLNLLIAELKSANLVAGALQPTGMKFGDNVLCGIFDEFVVAFPVVILAIR